MSTDIQVLRVLNARRNIGITVRKMGGTVRWPVPAATVAARRAENAHKVRARWVIERAVRREREARLRQAQNALYEQQQELAKTYRAICVATQSLETVSAEAFQNIRTFTDEEGLSVDLFNKQIRHFKWQVPVIKRRIARLTKIIERIEGEENMPPLLKGSKARSKKGIARNIRTEIKAGRPRAQSIAIAMRLAGKRKPRGKARKGK